MFKNVAVIGAGVMGTGIARHLAQSIDQVTLLDVNADQLASARKNVEGLAITCSDDFGVLGAMDYVIEAVFEDLNVKRTLLGDVSRICDARCIIASNTSSLLISDLAPAVKDPSRFVGVHYNNPADINPVLEVIAGEATRDDLADAIHAWMKSTGKLAVQCADTSGFILNRQSLPYINEAARCLDVATPGEVDAIATNELGVGLGPFAVMNLVGLGVMAASSRNLSVLGHGYEPAETLQNKAASSDPVWQIRDDAALREDVVIDITHRLLGAMMFPGNDILSRALCARDDLHMICIEALGYARSSPELLEQMSKDESDALIDQYLRRLS